MSANPEHFELPEYLGQPYDRQTLSEPAEQLLASVGLAANGLTLLDPEQLRVCNYWFDVVDQEAVPGRGPAHITYVNEYDFARDVHHLIADRVALGSRQKADRPGIVPRAEVEESLARFYRSWPAGSIVSEPLSIRRRQYQDQRLYYANTAYMTGRYGELTALYALRRALRDRELKHATRGAFNLIVAYGDVIQKSQTKD